MARRRRDERGAFQIFFAILLVALLVIVGIVIDVGRVDAARRAGQSAVALAVLASPLAPVGLARQAEVDPGLSADVPVLALGAVGVLAATVLSTASRNAGIRNFMGAAPAGRCRRILQNCNALREPFDPGSIQICLRAAGVSTRGGHGGRMG